MPDIAERCVACLGMGRVRLKSGDEETAVCGECNGRCVCRDCEEDGGCDAHGWAAPMERDEMVSAMLSTIEHETPYSVVDWLRGHGAVVQDGNVIRRMRAGGTVVFDTRLTRREKKDARQGRAVLVPHRCNGRPCLDLRCACRCGGCCEARRQEWARLGY